MNLATKLIAEIEKVLLGKPQTVRLAVACLLAEGHLLIDDIPGVGKTTLGVAMARSLGCSFQRIQFTSDLLPSDLLGVSIYNQRNQSFEFKPGPIFHGVVLADEINRASPKTQSALLEAMQERQVSLDNETYTLPHPFFVIATQNPHEHHGTFPLPESQLDRFMMRIGVGYPSPEIEARILRGESLSRDQIAVTSKNEEIQAAIAAVHLMVVDPALDHYVIEIAQLTRRSPLIELGLSPRGTLSMRRAAQAYAWTHERAYVIPDDIKAVAPSVMAHRMKIHAGQFNGNAAQARETLVMDLLSQVRVPA